MDSQSSLGEQIRVARQQKKFTQIELAHICRLNIRTIQRIENNEVKPRLYTLRILSKVLDVDLIQCSDVNLEKDELIKLRETFHKRKQIRIVLFITALFILFVALILKISGIQKLLWAPFIYASMFAIFIGIGLVWRCPGCNSILGDVFKSRYCPHCGLAFYDDQIS